MKMPPNVPKPAFLRASRLPVLVGILFTIRACSIAVGAQVKWQARRESDVGPSTAAMMSVAGTDRVPGARPIGEHGLPVYFRRRSATEFDLGG